MRPGRYPSPGSCSVLAAPASAPCSFSVTVASTRLITMLPRLRSAGKCIFGDGKGIAVGRINPFYWPGKGNACGFPDGTSITGQCWTNLTGGVWLSFQKPGECKNGAAIGHGGKNQSHRFVRLVAGSAGGRSGSLLPVDFTTAPLRADRPCMVSKCPDPSCFLCGCG